MQTVRFGIVGCGTMGREFASAAARWLHLPEMTVRPEIMAICNRTLGVAKIDWFTDNIPTIQQVTNDYHGLLKNPDVDAVYIAVTHNLHEEFYLAALAAGKHLMGEKPFGIDARANAAILAGIAKHPRCFVRCASQFLFFPAVQRIGRLIVAGAFGRILEVNVGFLHCSDLNPAKLINWKRTLEFNGAYGCMGDLGPHACSVPLRAGWVPRNVRAVLSNIVSDRPDGAGGTARCETWDNATLLCEASDPDADSTFPMTIRVQRISPGQQNNWYVEILGTQASARFSLKQPDTLEMLEYEPGGEQNWQRVEMGQAATYKSITPAVFEFGASDAILQMWAAYLHELVGETPPGRFARCVTPEETASWHKLFAAALESQATGQVVEIGGE